MSDAGRVFVFDDDADSLQSVVAALRRDGFEVIPFADPKVGLDRLAGESVDVIVTDLRMPGLTGMDVLRHVKRLNPDVSVVILTAYGTVDGAVDAVRSGASDFLMKPVEIPRLRAAVFKALKESGMRREIWRLREETGRQAGVEGIIVSSRAMEDVLRKIRLVAPTRMNVLITGESGTGKELVARAIHNLSPRVGQPFLPLNCAAIPETLLESELFG
ncbi:MAG: response regulator, partial [Syntrophorhabdaceae bacterium]|nr:response regulator [Syntrophorhabdaceae bacterium]